MFGETDRIFHENYQLPPLCSSPKEFKFKCIDLELDSWHSLVFLTHLFMAKV